MEKFKFDVVSRTLTITSKFAEQMENPESKEYQLVIRLQQDFPNLRFAKRTHKSPSTYTTKSGEKFNCNQYKNLTYERMEKFISALPQHEAYEKEYKFIKNFASAIQHNGYATVRKWFVAQFPEYRKNPLHYLNASPEIVNAATFLQTEGDEDATAKVA